MSKTPKVVYLFLAEKLSELLFLLSLELEPDPFSLHLLAGTSNKVSERVVVET